MNASAAVEQSVMPPPSSQPLPAAPPSVADAAAQFAQFRAMSSASGARFDPFVSEFQFNGAVSSDSLPQIPQNLNSNNHMSNFHEQLVVLHAQALLLTDAVAKTQQFIEQQRTQRKSKSKQVQMQLKNQLDQLMLHQQRQEQQFLMMLQRQQVIMQQNRPHISPQQHQQQQSQFFIYKQLMDNLLRKSHDLGGNPASTPAADRLLLLQALVHQQKLAQIHGEIQGGNGVGPSAASDFARLTSVRGAAASGLPSTTNVPALPSVHVSADTGSDRSVSSAIASMGTLPVTAVQTHSQQDAAFARESSGQAIHDAGIQPYIARPRNGQESIQMSSQKRELEALSRCQEQFAAMRQTKPIAQVEFHADKIRSQEQLVGNIHLNRIWTFSNMFTDTS